MENIKKLINDLSLELNTPVSNITTALKAYLPDEHEPLVSKELLAILNEKLIGKIVEIEISYYKKVLVLVKKISFNEPNEEFLIHGDALTFSPDMKIGDKTITYRTGCVFPYQIEGEYDIYCLDKIIVDNSEKLKRFIENEIKYLTLVGSHFYE